MDGAPGFALAAGLDHGTAPNWLANVDAGRLVLWPNAGVNSGTLGAPVALAPLSVGTSARYRF